MMGKNVLHLKLLVTLSVLFLSATFAEINQKQEHPKEFPRSEIFPPEDGELRPLQGKIVNGRYYAPKNIFSCQACDFSEGRYTAQDGLLDQIACVGFYNSLADFKKAEVIFMSWLEKKNLDEQALKDAFNRFGIGILKTVDDAQGIEILKEEMLGDNMFFAAISIDKMSVLAAPGGQYMASTRGYLIFQGKDKLAILSNQLVTLPGQRHTPKKHIEKLKKDILEFRKAFEFGLIPASSIEQEIIDSTSRSSERSPHCQKLL